MEKKLIFTMQSPFRDDFNIYGYHFGNGEKTVAIVGSMRGNEIQQLFVCQQLIKNLTTLEVEGKISKNFGILVIPTCNPYSLNIQKRFWAMDNTDINRMFPGYDQGETTQRIAAAIFDAVKDYTYGIQLASYYLNGNFIPHVRIMNTGYQDTQSAKSFGLPFVYEYEPSPFDTVVLNYNWQVFGTKAFSIYSGSTDIIQKDKAKMTWRAILRFLHNKEIISFPTHNGYCSEVFKNDHLHTIISNNAGMLYLLREVGDTVKQGTLLAKILDPYTGDTVEEISSPINGTIFFLHKTALIHQHSRLFQILGY